MGTGQMKIKVTQDSNISNKHISGTKSEKSILDKSKANQQQNTICIGLVREKSLLRSKQKEEDVIIKKAKLKDNISEMKEDYPSTRKVLKPNIESKVSLNQKSIAVEKWVENQNKYLDKGNITIV